MNSQETIDADHLIAELDALLGAGPAEPPAPRSAATPGSGASHVAALDILNPPPAQEAKRDGKPAEACVRVPKSKKVLVVDDSKDYRDVVRFLLEQTGYEVVEAVDGSEGLRTALRECPDLVLLDFNMPNMNGYELLQELRRSFELRKVPIIMFTGASNRSQLKKLGMDISAFLEKPVSNAQLLEAVNQAAGGPPERVELPRSETAAAPAPGLDVKEAGAASAAVPQPAPPPVSDLEDLEKDPLESLEDLQEAGELLMDKEDNQQVDEESGLEVAAHDSPLINHVNRILMGAVRMGASDIHIEPQERQINVRVRLNGSLKPLCTLPASLSARLSARIKIMSSLVITERRRPQDGQFRVVIQGKKIEFRVSTLPGTYGEKIVMRVLGTSKIKGGPGDIGLSVRDLECVERAAQSPNGLILVTGPTGSGKTTTLYTMISMLNKTDVNIMTAEDPVEYQLAGIHQVHVKPAIGLTFESVLRSFLRQDPDIMLIGEIRDRETAEIAVKASITGHLVLSTLHTNSAPATITRLTHMGVAPFLVSASVKLVVAQRLVKLLCPGCKLQVALSDEEKRLLTEEELSRMKDVYRGVGCQSCNQTGYVGRKPVFEVMPLRTAAMRQMILSSNDADLLTDLAVTEGMTSLRQAALGLVAAGATSLAEALKIVLSE